MLDLKALLTKIVEGTNYISSSGYNVEVGAKNYLDVYYNTSYSSALANAYQTKSFFAAQYNHHYRSIPISIDSVRAVDNQATPSSGLYAYNLLRLSYDHTYSSSETYHLWGIIYMTGVINHGNSQVTNTIVGYQPSGSAYCARENIKIPLPTTYNIASTLYQASVVVPFVSNNMLAPWITPYITKTSSTNVTLDMTSFLRMKATTAANAFSAIIVYWS